MFTHQRTRGGSAWAAFIAVAVIVGGGIITVPPQPAAATTGVIIPDGDYIIENVASHMVLDIPDASTTASTAIQLWTLNGTQAQQFHIARQSDGSYEIKNLGSKMNLDVRKGSRDSGAVIQQYTVNHTPAQRWYIYHVGSSMATVIFINAGSGLALDVVKNRTVKGAAIQQYTPNTTNAQSWLLAAVNPARDLAPGPFMIGRDGFVLEAPSCPNQPCVVQPVRLATYPPGTLSASWLWMWYWDGQPWGASVLWNDLYRGVVPKGGGTTAGTPVVVDPDKARSGGPDTMWKIVPGPKPPYYSIVNAYNLKALDITKGSIVAGTPLQLWAPNSTPAQLFMFYVIPH